MRLFLHVLCIQKIIHALAENSDAVAGLMDVATNIVGDSTRDSEERAASEIIAQSQKKDEMLDALGCQRTYFEDCPLHWSRESGENHKIICAAPLSYKGVCSHRQIIDEKTIEEKQALETECGLLWPCTNDRTFSGPIAEPLSSQTEYRIGSGYYHPDATCVERDVEGYACPLGYAFNFNTLACTPLLEYNGVCRDLDLFGKDVVTKRDTAAGCGVAFPCRDYCEEFPFQCPRHWTYDASTDKCYPPKHYTTFLSLIDEERRTLHCPPAIPQNFLMLSRQQRRALAVMCGFEWICARNAPFAGTSNGRSESEYRPVCRFGPDFLSEPCPAGWAPGENPADNQVIICLEATVGLPNKCGEPEISGTASPKERFDFAARCDLLWGCKRSECGEDGDPHTRRNYSVKCPMYYSGKNCDPEDELADEVLANARRGEPGFELTKLKTEPERRQAASRWGFEWPCTFQQPKLRDPNDLLLELHGFTKHEIQQKIEQDNKRAEKKLRRMRQAMTDYSPADDATLQEALDKESGPVNPSSGVVTAVRQMFSFIQRHTQKDDELDDEGETAGEEEDEFGDIERRMGEMEVREHEAGRDNIRVAQGNEVMVDASEVMGSDEKLQKRSGTWNHGGYSGYGGVGQSVGDDVIDGPVGMTADKMDGSEFEDDGPVMADPSMLEPHRDSPKPDEDPIKWLEMADKFRNRLRERRAKAQEEFEAEVEERFKMEDDLDALLHEHLEARRPWDVEKYTRDYLKQVIDTHGGLARRDWSDGWW